MVPMQLDSLAFQGGQPQMAFFSTSFAETAMSTALLKALK
jgi:hypothetical protein